MRMTQEQVDAHQARLRRADEGAAKQWLKHSSAPQPKRPKYGNRKVTDASGAVHDSTKEFHRWQVLELRERAGEIRSLRRQVPYALVVNGILVCSYVADFVFEEGAATVCEDVKSIATRKLPAYAIKKKLMKAIHKIEIREV